MREHPRGDRRLRARAHRYLSQRDSYESPLSRLVLHQYSIRQAIHETNH